MKERIDKTKKSVERMEEFVKGLSSLKFFFFLKNICNKIDIFCF